MQVLIFFKSMSRHFSHTIIIPPYNKKKKPFKDQKIFFDVVLMSLPLLTMK